MATATIAVSQQLQQISRRLVRDLNSIAGEPVAFSLIVFTDENAQYVSNAERDQVMGAMKKMVEKWEQGMPDVPAHRVS